MFSQVYNIFGIYSYEFVEIGVDYVLKDKIESYKILKIEPKDKNRI